MLATVAQDRPEPFAKPVASRNERSTRDNGLRTGRKCAFQAVDSFDRSIDRVKTVSRIESQAVAIVERKPNVRSQRPNIPL